MIEFRGRDVLVVSPQPWGDLHVSKHHYALELARRGARVLFLDPPSNARGFRIEEVDNGIHRIAHGMRGNARFRIKARPIYDLITRRHVLRLAGWIRTLHGRPLDFVWCFDPNLYSNLAWFGAGRAIYHPVDPVNRDFQRRPAQSASLLLTVSDKIMASFEGIAPAVPRSVIDHGLNEEFAALARAGLADDVLAGPIARPRIGYVGNLMRAEIDRERVLHLVDAFPQARFLFWGPAGESNLGIVDAAAKRFIDALRRRPNAELCGPLAPAHLAEAISTRADAFFLTYRFLEGTSDRSNSHKILEYLATGKPVVSVRISHYTARPDLISMPADDDDSKVEGLLGAVISRLSGNTSPAEFERERIARKRRREYALENTYERQVDRIARLLAAAPT